MTRRLVISVTLQDEDRHFDPSEALAEDGAFESDEERADFLHQFTPEGVAGDFLSYAQGWYIPREAGEAEYRVEAVIETPTVTAEVDGRWCEGEGHGDRPAAFQFVMLDTTSLDGIVDLCTECSWDHFKEWMKDPGDANGWEVRVLPIPPHVEPVMIQGGSR